MARLKIGTVAGLAGDPLGKFPGTGKPPGKSEGKRSARSPGKSPGKSSGKTNAPQSRLGDEFYKDFLTAWEEYGLRALQWAAVTDPLGFLRIGAALLPKVIEIDHEQRITVDEKPISDITRWVGELAERRTDRDGEEPVH